ncbi:S-adenosyl-L-methionine:benzoic acid/salicylic acid carboxyl methyltransferase 1-like [Amaranthus tricolor]|uniref:S-adenosyl-L-methionine:benzoic acid/salicylic acid carboxyl methyltransferase 1-like n=1 Tax=Amaranthus tricolor TaxID=29722 RepID=UPI00258C79E6|nr:S-adenosyl-L-methionine:benzoic acid/salicylic acid carboxyl methyltransferase 1-like [Amaranthus tricolor]
MTIQLKQVLRMKEGTDETSYVKTSYIQKQVLSLTKPIKEKAITELYYKARPASLCIADLGCSSAELNTLGVVSELIQTIEKARREVGNNGYQQEYQVYLNDLPGNDFNTIFRSLPMFEDKLKKLMGQNFGYCFINGVPGSFYGRLFPANHLHFVHSSYSLMWLSQVPEGIEDNKRNIYIGKTSPPNVVKAYYEQFEKDFSTFLRCRSEEVVGGGMMVLTILGRRSNEPYSKESCYEWDLLATVLNDMVFEGLIEEEKLNTFNIPQYTPSAAEVNRIVEKEGSFTLNHVDVSEVNWNSSEQHKRNHYDFARCMRSVAEPLLINHFDEHILEDLFNRYKDIVRVSMAKENNVFINVTVSLTRNG